MRNGKGFRRTVTGIALAAIAGALALPGSALGEPTASAQPMVAHVKADARRFGTGVRRNATEFGHGVVRGTHQAGRQFRSAGHQFHDDMRHLGRTLRHWWNH